MLNSIYGLQLQINRNAINRLNLEKATTTTSNNIKTCFCMERKTSLQIGNNIYPIFEEAIISNIAQAIVLKLVGQKQLTNEGLIHATILGIGLWTFLGWKGWLVCVSYLILGSLATKIKMAEKEVIDYIKAK